MPARCCRSTISPRSTSGRSVSCAPLLNTSVYGGKLYALPRDYESMHLFYNKELFKQNGWKLPTNRRRWKQVADAALAKGIIPFGAGNADWKGVNEWLMTVFFNNVAGPDNVRKALARRTALDRAALRRGRRTLEGLVQQGLFRQELLLADDRAELSAGRERQGGDGAERHLVVRHQILRHVEARHGDGRDADAEPRLGRHRDRWCISPAVRRCRSPRPRRTPKALPPCSNSC